MSVWFTSDLHIGHTSCAVKYRKFPTLQEHDEHIRKVWLETVGKRDKVFILGDIGHNKSKKPLDWYRDLPGYKHLIMGNHDQCHITEYAKIFDKVGAIVQYKKMWLTHAPLHPAELRGRLNVHGHIHNGAEPPHLHLSDARYFNVNIDMNDYEFVNLDRLLRWKEFVENGLTWSKR